ncbi:MAG: methyltransferase domain-containing protein [Magnetococcales bacterium]|nr:methyltransferase domain-containing protein [Magnetococcales bacterium]
MSATPDRAARETLEREQSFHDAWADELDLKAVPVRETFTLSTSPEPQWLLSRMGDLRGKRVMDLGCGAGEGAVYFALQGASVVAVDLSEGMLQKVQQVAALHGVTLETRQASADDLSAFEAESFDCVYGANLLHHVNIDATLAGVARVLKPGGMAAFWDPVEYNPAIQVYRRMATAVRTPDEHPLRRSDLALFSRYFQSVEKRFFWFTALLIFVKFYLIDGIHPSADRYWKRILSHEAEIRGLYRFLARMDRVLLAVLPFLGWWCWNMAVFVRKK